MVKITPCPQFYAPRLGPQPRIFHPISENNDQSTFKLRGPRPIRRAPTIMVLSDFWLLYLMRFAISAPKGLEP